MASVPCRHLSAPSSRITRRNGLLLRRRDPNATARGFPLRENLQDHHCLLRRTLRPGASSRPDRCTKTRLLLQTHRHSGLHHHRRATCDSLQTSNIRPILRHSHLHHPTLEELLRETGGLASHPFSAGTGIHRMRQHLQILTPRGMECTHRPRSVHHYPPLVPRSQPHCRCKYRKHRKLSLGRFSSFRPRRGGLSPRAPSAHQPRLGHGLPLRCDGVRICPSHHHHLDHLPQVAVPKVYVGRATAVIQSCHRRQGDLLPVE